MMSTIKNTIQRLKKGEKTRILGYGSSNTEHFQPGIHWLECLGIALREEYGKNATIINTGVGGNTTYDLLERFESDAAFYHPHLAIVTIGGNDCATANEVSPADFKANLHELHRRFDDLDAGIAFQTYYAPNERELEMERYEAFLRYSDVVREVASETGADLIDHLSRWLPLKENYPNLYLPLMRDGFHLNHCGNRVIGVDLARRFEAPITRDDEGYWREALEIQKVMDELQEKASGS